MAYFIERKVQQSSTWTKVPKGAAREKGRCHDLAK